MLAAVKQRARAKRRNAALHYESHRIWVQLSVKDKGEKQDLEDKIHHTHSCQYELSKYITHYHMLVFKNMG